MVAAAVVVLLLLGGTYYAAKRLSTPATPHDPVSVVIADFQNNTNDPTFDRTLEQTLRRGLEGASFISAYDRSRIRVGARRAAARQAGRSGGARAGGQAGARRRACRLDRTARRAATKFRSRPSQTDNRQTSSRRPADVRPSKDDVLDTATKLMATRAQGARRPDVQVGPALCDAEPSRPVRSR